MGKVPIYKPILIIVVSFVLFFGSGERDAHAQFPDSGFGSLLPMNSIQKFMGPLLPPGGISSTFRSELGMGGGMATLQRAKINSSQYGIFDLALETGSYDQLNGVQVSEVYQSFRSLDNAPSIYQIYSKIRLWRLAFNASYMYFDTLSRKTTQDGLFLNGLILGGDIDIIQNDWLSVGAAVNYFSTNPRFTFRDSSLSAYGFPRIHADFSGDPPSNIGIYLRYTPPEILNFPLHVEAHYYAPLKGSQWTNMGVALAFRPQIYRFDLNAKFKFERQFLKFSTNDRPATDQWEADFCWNIWGIDFGVYF